jgi:serine/threonine protein phosphatase 1
VKNWKNKAILIGNHERIFIDFILHNQEQYLDFIMTCGGKWIVGIDREVLVEWATYLKENCFYFLEFKSADKVIGCCHASVPFEDWTKMKNHFNDVHTNIIWSFDRFNQHKETKRAKKIKNIDGVIFGHVPVPKITKIKNSLYIDTGSYFIDYENFVLGDITFLEIKDAKKMLFK